MDSAWVAGAFGLVGALIGALATLGGIGMSNSHQEKIKAADLGRERTAVLHAYAAELELIAQLAEARSNALRRNAENGISLPASILRSEIIGKPYFLSRMGDQLSLIPPKLIEELTTAFVMCDAADSFVLRWVEHGEVVHPPSLGTLVTLMAAAAERCTKSATVVRQWMADAQGA